MSLKGSKTEANLKEALRAESETNRRYLYFASKADVEGHNDIDPATGMPFGSTEANLRSAIAGETYEYTEKYPAMAQEARDEGHNEIADWFEILAKAEQTHAERMQKMLDELGSGDS